jgi:hypothetical protein
MKRHTNILCPLLHMEQPLCVVLLLAALSSPLPASHRPAIYT